MHQKPLVGATTNRRLGPLLPSAARSRLSHSAPFQQLPGNTFKVNRPHPRFAASTFPGVQGASIVTLSHLWWRPGRHRQMTALAGFIAT